MVGKTEGQTSIDLGFAYDIFVGSVGICGLLAVSVIRQNDGVAPGD